MQFSIVVPTLNRPALLREALSSLAAQTYDDWEVIVVDDGSDPPVAEDLLAAIVGSSRLKVVRHAERRGIPAAKNAGLDSAAGDVVLYLDDDDLMAPTALQVLKDRFREHPSLDCIFLNVEPFGTQAEGTRALMDKAFQRLIEAACASQDEHLYYLGPSAFAALVYSVPLPMQRPAARRSVWNMIGGYCQTVAFSEPEWTMRAAASCRIALTKQPLQLWRVDGQNAYSRPEMYKVGVNSGIDSMKFLLGTFESQRLACKQRMSIVQTRLARAYLGRAWFVWQNENRTDFQALWLSFLTRPGLSPLRFLLRNAVLSVVQQFSGPVKPKSE